MKTKVSFCLIALAIIHLSIPNTFSQPLGGYTFKIVNMTPNAQSDEIFFDSETNIAVTPANALMITGSAFTKNPTGSTNSAPIYVSSTGGTTWSLNNIVPSGNGMTGDISLGFASSSETLYAGILRGGSTFRCMMLRTTTPTGSTIMTTLADRSTVSVDQPWVSATTVNDATSTPRDRIFAGDNLYGSRKSVGGDGRTAEVMVSNDAGSASFSGFTNRITEVRNTFEEDMPAIRTAIHSSGTVYAVYYSWLSGSPTAERCDVVVVRDDNFATGATPFSALTDTGDGQAGQRVVTNVLVPAFFGVSLGSNRLVASNLAIAVDPSNSANVFVAWCDRVGSTDYTAHFRRSSNNGQSWESSDWLTITDATNPGIAVTSDGKVGLIYQQLTGSGSSARWETHFRFTTVTGTTFTDDILSTFLDSDLSASTISPSLGDYLRIQAIGRRFFGVFPASNRADNANFPLTVTYQRNHDFATKQLRNLTNTSNVAVSVDPFFFKISPFVISTCALRPDLCHPIPKIKFKFVIPGYFCPSCPPPPPCLTCPYVIDFRSIYETLINPQERIILDNPYFHLMLEDYDPQNFDIKIMTRDGGFVAQELNKTDTGYALSFHPSKKNYSQEQGIHDLDIAIAANTEEAAKTGAEINYKLYVSDYR
jgi:hypothetical protein